MTYKADEQDWLDGILHDLYLAGWNDGMWDKNPKYHSQEMSSKRDASSKILAHYAPKPIVTPDKCLCGQSGTHICTIRDSESD